METNKPFEHIIEIKNNAEFQKPLIKSFLNAGITNRQFTYTHLETEPDESSAFLEERKYDEYYTIEKYPQSTTELCNYCSGEIIGPPHYICDPHNCFKTFFVFYPFPFCSDVHAKTYIACSMKADINTMSIMMQEFAAYEKEYFGKSLDSIPLVPLGLNPKYCKASPFSQEEFDKHSKTMSACIYTGKILFVKASESDLININKTSEKEALNRKLQRTEKIQKSLNNNESQQIEYEKKMINVLNDNLSKKDIEKVKDVVNKNFHDQIAHKLNSEENKEHISFLDESDEEEMILDPQQKLISPGSKSKKKKTIR